MQQVPPTIGPGSDYQRTDILTIAARMTTFALLSLTRRMDRIHSQARLLRFFYINRVRRLLHGQHQRWTMVLRMNIAFVMLGMSHGFVAAVMFAVILDKRSRASRAKRLRSLCVRYPTTVLLIFFISRNFIRSGATAFLISSLATFALICGLLFIYRPRRIRPLGGPPLRVWPLQALFERSFVKGLGVVLSAVGVIVAFAGSAGIATLLCVGGTLLWGGADVYAGIRSVVSVILEAPNATPATARAGEPIPPPPSTDGQRFTITSAGVVAPPLPNESVEVLLAAADSSEGQVVFARYDGTLAVQVCGREFLTDHSPQNEARFEDAVQRLRKYGLLAGEGEVLRVTSEGFSVAAGIRKRRPKN
jgi:hypothetical protein